MPEFLTLVPPQTALGRLLDAWPARPAAVEEIQTISGLGRVIGEDVRASSALPAFARSTVDGYAVRARDTFGANESLPAYLALIGEVPMGAEPEFTVGTGQVAVIHTGGMLPAGADAVVMLEFTQPARPGEIEALRAAAAGENVIQPGEDVQPGQVVLPSGTRLGSAEIGGLMALGVMTVRAVVRPRVGILSSGDEVVPPEDPPRPGQVRDINSYSLSALVETAGGQPVRYGIIPDRAEALRGALDQALRENDVVVITAGSSASARDLTAQAIQEAGEPGVLVHGVNVRPGKPTILGVCTGKPVIGLPGNPVSALVIAGLFLIPVIERCLGRPSGRPAPAVQARLTTNVPSQAGREDWTPVRLLPGAGMPLAEPIFYQSNLIFNLARADGLVRIPPEVTGLEAGASVAVVRLFS